MDVGQLCPFTPQAVLQISALQRGRFITSGNLLTVSAAQFLTCKVRMPIPALQGGSQALKKKKDGVCEALSHMSRTQYQHTMGAAWHFACRGQIQDAEQDVSC